MKFKALKTSPFSSGRKPQSSKTGNKSIQIGRKSHNIRYSQEDLFKFFAKLLKERFEAGNVKIDQMSLLRTTQKAWNDLPLSTMEHVVSLFEKDLRDAKTKDQGISIKSSNKLENKQFVNISQLLKNSNQKKRELNGVEKVTTRRIGKVVRRKKIQCFKKSSAVGEKRKDLTRTRKVKTNAVDNTKRNRADLKRRACSTRSSVYGKKSRRVNGQKAKEPLKRTKIEKPCPITGGKCRCKERQSSAKGDVDKKMQKKRNSAKKAVRGRDSSDCSSQSSSNTEGSKGNSSFNSNSSRSVSSASSDCSTKSKGKKVKGAQKTKNNEKSCPITGGKCRCKETFASAGGKRHKESKLQNKKKSGKKAGSDTDSSKSNSSKSNSSKSNSSKSNSSKSNSSRSVSSASSACTSKPKGEKGKKANNALKTRKKETPCPITGGKCRCKERVSCKEEQVKKVQMKRKIAKKTRKRADPRDCSSSSRASGDKIKRKNSAKGKKRGKRY